MNQINVIDELLALSEKEARKILSETNIYKAKYFTYRDEGDVFVKCSQKTKFGNVYHLSTQDNPIFISAKAFVERYGAKVLSYSKLVEFKASRAYNKIRQYDVDAFIKYLESITSQFYEKEYFSINKKSSNSIELVIHFPEIKITNSVEFEHTIRDLYFIMYFQKDREYSSSNTDEWRLRLTSGMRGTMEDREILTSYTHSHFSGDRLGSYNLGDYSWCYGSTDLDTVHKDLRRGKLYGNLNSFLASLEGYLSWESLEGSPYKRIESTIKFKNGLSRVSSPYISDYNTLLKEVLSENIDLDWNYVLTDGKYRCKLDQSSIDNIDSILSKKHPNWCYIIQDGDSYQLTSQNNFDKSRHDNKKTELYFKGNQVVTKVITTLEEPSNNTNKRIHRYTLNNVIRIMEDKLTEFVTNKYCER